MKRVLIIAYYWPPSGGSGVQRWLKFAKYLPQFGWEPIIYTPENPDFSLYDESLLADIPKEVKVIKQPIWEPYSLGRKLMGRKKDEKSSAGVVSNVSLKGKVMNWIRGNLFIPDPKVFWRKPSVKFLTDYLKANPVDAIISTGTPHSMHLIALDLKNQIGLPWLADFRDPWSELDMLKSYNILPPIMKIYRKLEKVVITNSDVNIITSKTWAKDLEALGAKKVEVITNGFDEADFNFKIEPYNDFVVSHFGLLNHLRNPINFWKALNALCEEDSAFNDKLKIHLGGTIAKENLDEIKKFPLLKEKLKVFPYLSHEEVIQEYLKSSLLLLLLFNSDSGKGNIPGKVFEYVASGRPIIGFGSAKGDSADIIEKVNGEFFLYSTNHQKLMDSIKNIFYSSVDSNQERDKDQSKAGELYSRKNLTKQLVAQLETITSSS